MSESKLIKEALKQIFEADAGQVQVVGTTGKGKFTQDRDGKLTDSSGEEQARLNNLRTRNRSAANAAEPEKNQVANRSVATDRPVVPGSAGSSDAETYLPPEPKAPKTGKELAGSGPLGGSPFVSAGATSLDRDDIALRTTEMENKRKMAAQAERRAEAAGPGQSYGSVSPKEVEKEPEARVGYASDIAGETASADGSELGKPTTTFKMPKRPITPTPAVATDTATATAAEQEAKKSHKVQKGENLWNIIKQRGKTAGKTMSNTDIANEVKRLAKLNKMKDPNRIMPGQEIKFEETEMTISKSLIDAFNGVVSSKHPNVFQEAKKLSPKQKEIAKIAGDPDKIDAEDFKKLRKEEKKPEEYDVTGSGVMTYTDPKTGEKKDYIPDIHMKGSKNIPVPTPRPKKIDESLFSEAELAYFEGVGKIAGKPDDKSVPAGKDTSNATGSRSGTLSDEYVEEGRRGRPPKGESLGANELHMNAKRAADNMDNVTHTFANGQKVKMTKAMGAGFLARHLAAKTPDAKDAILNHAHSSLSAFKDVVEGKPIPEKKKKGISLAGNM